MHVTKPVSAFERDDSSCLGWNVSCTESFYYQNIFRRRIPVPQLSARRIRRDVTRRGVKKKKRASLVTGCEKNTFHIPRATFFKRLVHTVAFILLRRRYLTVIRRCDCVAFSNVQSPIERHRADTKISPKVSLQEGGHLFPWCYVHSVRKTLGN